MTKEEFLDQAAQALKAQNVRIQAAVKGMDGVQMNDIPPDGLSVSQILEHMRLSGEAYLLPINLALANPVKGDQDLNLSKFGKLINDMAGPKGKASIPKKLKPARRTYGLEVVHQVINMNDKFVTVFKQCSEVDLVATRFTNPVIGFLKMSLYDAFVILIDHNERHILQIEARVK